MITAALAIFASTAFASWDGTYYTNDTDSAIEVTVISDATVSTVYGPFFYDGLYVTRQVPAYSSMDFWYESKQEFIQTFWWWGADDADVSRVDLVSG